MLKYIKKYLFFFAIVLVLLAVSHTVFALEFAYPAIPGLSPGFAKTDNPDLPALIKYFFGLAVALAGILGVLSIVISGIILLIKSGSPGSMGEARERIFGSILGIILLLFSVVLLNTINPGIVGTKETKLTSSSPKIPVIIKSSSSGNGPKDLQDVSYIVAPESSDTDDILDGFEWLLNNCSGNNDIIVHKNGGKGETAVDLPCGAGTSIASFDSYEWEYKEPGVYLFKGPGCFAGGSETTSAISTAGWNIIPTGFERNIKSALVVLADSFNEPNYAFVLNEDPRGLGTCSLPYTEFSPGVKTMGSNEYCVPVSPIASGGCGGGGGGGDQQWGKCDIANHVCSLAGTGSACSTDTDCAAAQAGACAPDGSAQCVADTTGMQCATDKQCGGGNSYCNDDILVGSPVCVFDNSKGACPTVGPDASCATTQPAFCDLTNQRCITDGSLTQGISCNPANNNTSMCTTPPCGVTNSDCSPRCHNRGAVTIDNPSQWVCELGWGDEGELCTDASTCGGNENWGHCHDNVCSLGGEGIPCSTSSECTGGGGNGGSYCVSGGVLSGASGGAPGGGATGFVGGGGRSGGGSGSKCVNYLPGTNPPTGSISCTDQTSCGGTGTKCESGKCVQGSLSQSCDPQRCAGGGGSGSKCVALRCVSGASSDYCDAQACASGGGGGTGGNGSPCGQNSECASEKCVNGTCSAGNNGDFCGLPGDCTSGNCLNGVCSGGNDGTCGGPTGCPGGTCAAGVCTGGGSVQNGGCIGTNQCSANAGGNAPLCTYNGDCVGGSHCVYTGSGGACLPGAVFGQPTCSTQTNCQTLPGSCTTDANCPAGQVCSADVCIAAPTTHLQCFISVGGGVAGGGDFKYCGIVAGNGPQACNTNLNCAVCPTGNNCGGVVAQPPAGAFNYQSSPLSLYLGITPYLIASEVQQTPKLSLASLLNGSKLTLGPTGGSRGCGDGVCDFASGEGPSNCPADCNRIDGGGSGGGGGGGGTTGGGGSGNCLPAPAASIYILPRLDQFDETNFKDSFAGNGVTIYEYGGSSAKDGHRKDTFDLAGPRSVILTRPEIGAGFRYTSPDQVLKDGDKFFNNGVYGWGYDYDKNAPGKDICAGGSAGGTCIMAGGQCDNGKGTCTADNDCQLNNCVTKSCQISGASCSDNSGCPQSGDFCAGQCETDSSMCFTDANCSALGFGNCVSSGKCSNDSTKTCTSDAVCGGGTTATNTKSQYPCTQSIYSEGNFVVGLYSGNQTNDTNQFCQFFTTGVDNLVDQKVLENGKEILDFYVWPVVP